MKNVLEELNKCEDDGKVMPEELFNKFVAATKANPRLHGFIHRTMLDGVMRIGMAGPQEAFQFVLHRAVALGYLLALNDVDIKKKAPKEVNALLNELFKTKKEVAGNDTHRDQDKRSLR